MIRSPEDKQQLCILALDAISSSLRGKKKIIDDPGIIREGLQVNCGVFVSVYVRGKLRGCIGTFTETRPLYLSVQEMAVAAATSDTRFDAIAPDEIEHIQLEISALSPRKRISGPEEIIIGKHGIFVEKQGCRGTLLPQVAVQQNWDARQFLSHCSRYKAGLGWDGWMDADLYVFEAFIVKSRDNKTA